MTTQNGNDEKYLFTFSPIGTTKNYNFAYYDHLGDYFRHWHQCMESFEINPELNASGNLHYHGFFILKNKYKWFKSILPKMKYHGMVKINKVHCDLQKAMEYCRKDRELMNKLITIYPVPYTDKSQTVKDLPKILPIEKTMDQYFKTYIDDLEDPDRENPSKGI